MKYLLFIPLLFISLNCFAQPEYDERLSFLKIQGGLVFDSQTSKDYAGFNYLNLGFSRYKSLRVDGLELEIMAFEQIVERPSRSAPGTASFLADWNCERRSVELSAFRTYPLVNSIKNGVFVGGYFSAGFIKTKLNPVESSYGFPLDSDCYCFGIGGKLDYYAQLTNKIYLTIGAKINLIGTGYYIGKIQDPSLTVRQQKNTSFETGLLQGKIPLTVGLSFSI